MGLRVRVVVGGLFLMPNGPNQLLGRIYHGKIEDEEGLVRAGKSTKKLQRPLAHAMLHPKGIVLTESSARTDPARNSVVFYMANHHQEAFWPGINLNEWAIIRKGLVRTLDYARTVSRDHARYACFKPIYSSFYETPT